MLFCKGWPGRAVCDCSSAGCKLVCRQGKNRRRHIRGSHGCFTEKGLFLVFSFECKFSREFSPKHHRKGCKLSSEARNSLENFSVITLILNPSSFIYPPYGWVSWHPYVTLDTLRNRVQAQCLSGFWHPYTLKMKNSYTASLPIGKKHVIIVHKNLWEYIWRFGNLCLYLQQNTLQRRWLC